MYTLTDAMDEMVFKSCQIIYIYMNIQLYTYKSPNVRLRIDHGLAKSKNQSISK